MCVGGGNSHTTLIVPHLSVITVALRGTWRSQFDERVAHSTSAVNIPVRVPSPPTRLRGASPESLSGKWLVGNVEL